MEFLPIHPRFAAAKRRVRGASGLHRGIAPARPTIRGSLASRCEQEESMKAQFAKSLLSVVLAFALLCSAAPSALAEPHQVIQGTEVHLTLLNPIGTNISRDGDPFVAIVAEPVFMGNTLLIPAGARINGLVGNVERARRFSAFRGQAYMNLTFRSLEIDSRLIPIQMSIITIEQPRTQGDTKRRKDVKVDEGQVIEQKHDYKGDIVGGSIGTGGGALVGAIFSNVARGFGFGIAGSAVYIMARKGKEVELPAQTGLLVRMDNTITVPSPSASNASYTNSR